MSKTIYLYLKTHNKTGLKYLGKTVQNPYEYCGSGLVWIRHLKKHGNDVTTEILFETTDIEEFKKVSLEYSEKWEIVESKEFANLMVEQGAGGDTFSGKKHTPETIKKISERKKGTIVSEETRKKLSEAGKGRVVSEETKIKQVAMRRANNSYGKSKGYTHTDEYKKHMSELRKNNNPGFSQKSICPYCKKEGQNAIMKRWHFDNCKDRK